ncbi:MAG: antitoxin [Pseudonocardia sp.]
MPGMFKRLAALSAAAEAARRYAQKNPDKVRGIADKAAKFADDRTKGKYTNQINSAKQKLNHAAGTDQQGYGQQGYGQPGQQGYGQSGQGYQQPGPNAPQPGPRTPQPGPRTPPPGQSGYRPPGQN